MGQIIKKYSIYVTIFLLIFVSGCSLIDNTQTTIEDINENPQNYAGKNDTFEVSNYDSASPYRVFDLGINTRLCDINGYEIHARVNIKNRLPPSPKYLFKGTMDTFTLCDCIVKDTVYKKDHVYFESNWTELTTYYTNRQYFGIESMPLLNEDTITLESLCVGNKTKQAFNKFGPYYSNDVEVNITRSYKCRENSTKIVYYVDVYEAKVFGT